MLGREGRRKRPTVTMNTGMIIPNRPSSRAGRNIIRCDESKRNLRKALLEMLGGPPRVERSAALVGNYGARLHRGQARGGFADRRDGHIILQDHNEAAWFRNIKIRELKP